MNIREQKQIHRHREQTGGYQHEREVGVSTT